MRAQNGSLQRAGGANGTMRQSTRSFGFLRRMILFIVFIYLGISLGIPGVTLIYFEKLTASREDEVALIFSSRAVGGLAGWLLGLLSLDLDNFEPTTLMSLGTLGLFLTHLLLPWAVQLWWVLCGFTFQGALMAITVQGCLAFVRKHQPKRLANSSNQLIFACLFGCVVCPFIVLPFLKETSVISEHRGLNAFLDEQAFRIVHNVNGTVAPRLPIVPSEISVKRQRRDVSESDFMPSNAITEQQLGVSITTSSTPMRSENVTQSPLIKPQSTVSSTLERDLLNLSTTNVNSSSLQNTTTKMMNVDPTTTPVPKKPSVIDAKHLNQDASSADGSNTAVKMKQLGEERRIDTVAGAPAVAPRLQDTVAQISSPPATSDGMKTSVIPFTNMTNPPSSNLTQPGSSPKANATVVAITNTPSIPKLSNSTRRDESLLLHDTLVTVTNITSTTTTTASTVTTTPVVSPASNASHNPLDIGSSVISSAEFTTPARPVSLAITTPTTTHRRHIVEHQGNSNFASRFLFTHPLQPVQKVYCFLGALGLFIWLLTISLTDWCQGTCGFRADRLSNDRIRMRVRRFSHVAEDSHPLVSQSDSEEALYTRRHSDWNRAPAAETSNSEDNSDDDSHYISAQEIVLRSDPESIQQADSQIGVRAQFACTQGRQKPPPAQWPRVSWPMDAWLLLAEFFSTGLETAFSGFVHGFTVRYLLWTPSLGFLANSLFWLGGLVGRLPCLFLLNVKAHREPKSVLTSSPIPQTRPGLQHRASLFNLPAISSVKNSKAYWRLALIRIFGSLLCTLSAVSLTRFSLSSDNCAVGSSERLINTSANYVIWLGGSLFLGLGIGISSSTMGTTISDTNLPEDRNVHRLQLAGHIGQMLIPATVGYVHHIAVFWHYACILSSVALVLGLLMTATLVIDLVTKVVLKQSGEAELARNSVPTLSSSGPGGSQQANCAHTSDVKHALSPVTLHSAAD